MLIEAGRLRLAEKAREAVTCVAQISDTKKPPSGGLIASLGAKAGLEHRNYPYDLNEFKITTLDKIPSQFKFGCG